MEKEKIPKKFKKEENQEVSRDTQKKHENEKMREKKEVQKAGGLSVTN